MFALMVAAAAACGGGQAAPPAPPAPAPAPPPPPTVDTEGDPATPAPDDGVDQAIAAMAGFADEICACADLACVEAMMQQLMALEEPAGKPTESGNLELFGIVQLRRVKLPRGAGPVGEEQRTDRAAVEV
jgi:hypothetical protein